VRCCRCRKFGDSISSQRGSFPSSAVDTLPAGFVMLSTYYQPYSFPTFTFSAPHVSYTRSQFVYEPHLAPRIEVWAEEFLARRRAARNRAAAVPASTRRRSSISSESSSTEGDPSAHPRSHLPHDMYGSAFSAGRGASRRTALDSAGAESYELEGLVTREVDEWRNEVRRSQDACGLRRRRGLGLGGRRNASDVEYDMLSTSMDEVRLRFFM